MSQSSLLARIAAKTQVEFFDVQTQAAVYALPTFENEDDNSPAHLTRNPKMSKTMVTSLILAKTSSSYAGARALTRQIIEAAEVLEAQSEHTGTDPRQACRCALAENAAEHLSLRDVIRFLSATQETRPSTRELVDNATVAAVSMNVLRVVEKLLATGACGRTRLFGDSLSIAARLGHRQAFSLLINVPDKDMSALCGTLTGCRISSALEEAAKAGQEHIVNAILDLRNDLKCPHALDRAIIGAARATQVSALRLLMHYREACEIDSMRSTEHGSGIAAEMAFRHDLLRVAACSGCVPTVRFVMDIMSTKNHDFDIALPLEDASQRGHHDVLRMLLSQFSDRPSKSYSGALYWAARIGNQDIVDLLLDKTVGTVIDALAGAASSRQVVLINHLLERSNSAKICEHRNRLGLFVDALHCLLVSDADLISRVPVDTRSTMEGDPLFLPGSLGGIDQPVEVYLLRTACENQQLGVIKDLLSSYATQHPDDDLSIFSASCSVAVCRNLPGTLLYLCSRVPPLFSTDMALRVKSTAIFQVFLDHGWDINGTFHRLCPPPLGSVVDDEHLTRWFLDRDADPNARCDWDITPLSAAMRKASIFTIKLLLQRGGDIRKGQLIHFAVERETSDAIEVIEMLLDLGASLTSIQYENDAPSWLENMAFGMGTPLHLAAKRGSYEIVSYLLYRGAERTLKDSLGRTALEVAENEGHTEVLELLRAEES